MSARPTIALVAHGVHDQGGMERSLYELVSRTHERFHYVVVSAELAPDLVPFVEWRRIRVPMRPIPLKIVAFAAVAGFTLRRITADTVHTMGAIVPNRTDVASVQFCSAGFLNVTRRLAPAEAPPLRRVNTALARLLGLALERWCYRPGRVGAFAAVSGGVARELERHYPGIPSGVTPNAADTQRFKPDVEARATLREREGVRADEVVALFVGGDWDRKGLEHAIDGAARASLRLWVVGEGDVSRFARLATERGANVRFFGRQPDTERWYAAADVFVFPTLYEADPLVVHEAAASGLPIVATRVNGIVDVVGDEVAGLLVGRNGADVGEALTRLAADPALRARLGAAAREHALDYDWANATDGITELWSAR